MSAGRGVRAFLLAGCLPVCSALLGGCLSSGQPAESGVRIGDKTLEQFRAGITTESWLLAILGKPTSWAWVRGVENTKVLRYATGESATGIGAVFSGKASRNTSVVYFIITDGIVTRYWADRATERTLLGRKVEESGGEKSGETEAP